MTKITSTIELRQTILQLENRQKIQQQLLTEQFNQTYTSLKPLNILRGFIHDAVTDHEIQYDLLGYTAHLAGDFLTKKILNKEKGGVFNEYIRQLVHYGINALICNSRGSIKAISQKIYDMVFGSQQDES